MDNQIIEKQKQEAIKRLNVLRSKGLMTNVVSDFIEKGLVYYSERTPMGGILYWLTEDNNVPKRWLDEIKEFEEEYGAKVYHATHEKTCFGECLDLFYVSNNEEEWEYDNKDLNNDIVVCKVINLDDDLCSEIGSIGIMCLGGGIVRTA